MFPHLSSISSCSTFNISLSPSSHAPIMLSPFAYLALSLPPPYLLIPPYLSLSFLISCLFCLSGSLSLLLISLSLLIFPHLSLSYAYFAYLALSLPPLGRPRASFLPPDLPISSLTTFLIEPENGPISHSDKISNIYTMLEKIFNSS